MTLRHKPHPNFILLYVDDPIASAAFYASLLGKPAAEASPTFALFALDSGVMLGLWSRRTVEPAAVDCDAELAIAVADGAAVDAAHAAWRTAGRAILQPPAELDFGRSFVATDPDGHRLRVFAPVAP